MPNYPLKFTKGATIPPSVRLSVTLEKTSDRDRRAKGTGTGSPEDCPECEECPDPNECPEIFLPAGADNYADAPEIPLSEFHDLLSLPTYNRFFSVETGEPDHGFGDLFRTAWWKVFVPAGQVWHISVDTRFSFWERSGIPDTVLAIYGAFEPHGITDLGPSIADNDDTVDSQPAAIYRAYSHLSHVELQGNVSGDDERDPPDGKGPGTWFYIQCSNLHNESLDLDGEPASVAYVLRVSLTQFEVGSIPPGEHDPDSWPEPDEP